MGRKDTSPIKARTPREKVTSAKAPPASRGRLDFLAGQIKVPDDFDRMAGDEIEALFSGRPHKAVRMTTAADLRRMALSLEGTTEAPHFDRAAFKVARIYVTLAADGRTVNFKFAPDEQELKCTVAPDAFAAVPNAWGRQGWTTATLAKLTAPELRDALEMAWRHALPKKGAAGRKKARRR